MTDQAARLRQLFVGPEYDRFPERESGGPLTIVVASGKGGVGKSVVSVVVAKALADLDRQVLLLEGDQNLGHLHVLLGVRPADRLEALLRHEVAPADLLTPIGERLSLLAGDSASEGLYVLGSVDRARLHQRLNSLYHRFQAVVIDAGSDLESIVRVASFGASRMVIVTVPEPAALADAYAVMKIVHLRVPGIPTDVLVNRADNDEEGRRTFEHLATACRRFLKQEPQYLGTLPEDRAIHDAVRQPGALLTALPNSTAVSRLRALVATRATEWRIETTAGSVLA